MVLPVSTEKIPSDTTGNRSRDRPTRRTETSNYGEANYYTYCNSLCGALESIPRPASIKKEYQNLHCADKLASIIRKYGKLSFNLLAPEFGI